MATGARVSACPTQPAARPVDGESETLAGRSRVSAMPGTLPIGPISVSRASGARRDRNVDGLAATACQRDPGDALSLPAATPCGSVAPRLVAP